MKRILLILLLLPSLAYAGDVTVVTVQSAMDSKGATSPLIINGVGDATDDWVTPASGNLLICVAGVRRGTGTTVSSQVIPPAGWTAVESAWVTLASRLNGGTFYRVSDGTESSISFSITTLTDVANWSVGCEAFTVTGADLTAVDVSSDNETNINNTGTTVQPTAATSITPSKANSVVFAVVVGEITNDWNLAESIDQSYTKSADLAASTTARPTVIISYKDLASAAAQSPSVTTTDVGGRAYGAIFAFVEASSAPVLTCAGESVTLGGTIVCTAASTIGGTAANFHNVTTGSVVAGTGGTTTALTLTANPDQFITGGTFAATNIGVAHAWKICDAGGTNCSGNDSITINGYTCSPPNCTAGSGTSVCIGNGTSCPADSDWNALVCPGAPAYPQVGDKWFCRFSTGNGECGDAGNVFLDVAGSLTWNVFDASNSNWCTARTVDYTNITDVTAPVLSAPLLTCAAGLCDARVTTDETNGTAYFLVTQATTVSVATCQASLNRTTLGVSPINFGGISVARDGFYRLAACQKDNQQNSSTVVLTGIQYIVADGCGSVAGVTPGPSILPVVCPASN